MSGFRDLPGEQARIRDLLAAMPKGRLSVLDIGARDGYITRLLTGHFQSVTGLDLELPAWTIDGVETVQGDARRLKFPDGHFDVVVASEVLEHIPSPGLEQACRELLRVARHEVVIGVPYRQDIRLGRLTCAACGGVSPPWGHVNSFSEDRLQGLFHPARVSHKSFAGERRARTNALSVALMDLAGNPWGDYSQEERCIHCGAAFTPPPRTPSPWTRALTGAAHRMSALQTRLAPPLPNWIHLVFRR